MNDKLKSRPPRSWLRRCSQFSLQTLLLVMTASAVACWWWLQPQAQDELLAGDHLKLRRQVLLDKEAHPESPSPWINVGSWRLYDNHGDMLVNGQYRHGLPHGRWTLHYPNGQKAAQGSVVAGQRSGQWRTWDDAGRLTSEVTYRSDHEIASSADVAYEKYRLPKSPSWGCGSSYDYRWGTRRRRELAAPPLPAVRHGPATVFTASGEVRWSGTFQNDRREEVLGSDRSR